MRVDNPSFVGRARSYLTAFSSTPPDSNAAETERNDTPKLSALRKARNHRLADYGFLLGICGLLLVVGLVMVLSASTVLSLRSTGSSYTLFLRQIMFAGVGICVLVFLSRMPVLFFRRIALIALIASGSMLIMVLVPGIGKSVNGQTNWISLGGPFQVQPSEFAKYALVLWLALVLSRTHDRVDNWRTLLIPIAPVSGCFLFLILAEGDLGTCMVIMPMIAGMLLVAGAPKRLFGWLGGGVLLLILMMSVAAPYRMARFATWLDPAANADGAGYQVIHGQFALATGGWWGVGLGASREKWGFLPEAQTDFIMSVIGEELGLVGTLSILGLFAALAVVIFQISQRTDDLFVNLAATGFGVWIILQAIINIGAVLGLLPITGLPLPLVSYGGSSLLATLMAIGTLLAFARAQRGAQELLTERSNAKKVADARRTHRRPTRRASRGQDGATRPERRNAKHIDLTDPQDER